jgi:membrane fusion protein, multidrug efflux system
MSSLFKVHWGKAVTINVKVRDDAGDQAVVEPLDPSSNASLAPEPARNGAVHALLESDGVQARGPAPDRRPGVAPPPDESKPEQDVSGDSGAPQRKRFAARRAIAVVIGLVALAAIVAGGYVYWDYAEHFQSTDDAFIASRQFAVAPKVSGYITAVPVTDNQHVVAGDVLARIDDRDYRIALAQAQAQVDGANANIRNIAAQISVQQEQISASEAQVEQAQAALTFAQQQAARYHTLAQREAGTVEMAQQMDSTLRQQQATVKNTQAALAVAQRQIDALQAQRSSAEANLALAQAQRDQAQLNLSYTTVTAAQAGRVVSLSAAVGQFAQGGTDLAMFVPDEIWVTANFKETQLAAMRPGQPATVQIDAYPDRAIRGHVASVQPGSGTAFSLLPAENATGNYVKIVQRVPVKIIIDDPPADVALGPGMSVVPTVRVDPRPSSYERLTGRL